MILFCFFDDFNKSPSLIFGKRSCFHDHYGVAIVDRAIKYGCKKLQLFNDKFDQAMIDRAHEHGIICNVCQANKTEKAEKYLSMGIDTILTNEYLLIKQTVDKAGKYTTY